MGRVGPIRRACEDDGNNGFGLLFNWNRLGDGMHTVRALADGVEFANATVTVSALEGEFVTGLSGEFMLDGFPGVGQATSIEWEESLPELRHYRGRVMEES